MNVCNFLLKSKILNHLNFLQGSLIEIQIDQFNYKTKRTKETNRNRRFVGNGNKRAPGKIDRVIFGQTERAWDSARYNRKRQKKY